MVWDGVRAVGSGFDFVSSFPRVVVIRWPTQWSATTVSFSGFVMISIGCGDSTVGRDGSPAATSAFQESRYNRRLAGTGARPLR
jgi:hypothetical protein